MCRMNWPRSWCVTGTARLQGLYRLTACPTPAPDCTVVTFDGAVLRPGKIVIAHRPGHSTGQFVDLLIRRVRARHGLGDDDEAEIPPADGAHPPTPHG